MTGLAFKIRDYYKSRYFHRKSGLYIVTPAAEVNDNGFITETSYVIVAYTPVSKTPRPQAEIDADMEDWGGPLDGPISTFVDGPPETTCFAGCANGKLYSIHHHSGLLGFNESSAYEDDEFDPGCRVVGSCDHQGVLNKLQWGYRITESIEEFMTQFNGWQKQIGRLPLDMKKPPKLVAPVQRTR